MANICAKPSGSCPTCEHFRYDKEYGGMACWAQADKKNAEKEAKDSAAAH